MSKLTNERTLKSYVWASIALVLTLAMLLAVSYPGLRTVAEELTDNNGGGYSSSEGSEVSKDVLKVYENGTIKLRSFEDLQKVGTGAALTTEDGTQVYDISGYAVTYALDANYMVVEDIVLPAGQKWVLPKNFTGYIAEETEVADAPTTKAEVEKAIADAEKAAKDHPLYDEETNAILIYNPYQLVTLAQEDAAEQPVMSLDFEAATYGMGQLVSGTEGDLLTYDPANTYVISTHFNSATPELLSEKLKTLTLEEDSSEDDTGLVPMDGVKAKLAKAPAKAPSAADANVDTTTGLPYDGRDYGGQVVMTIDSTKYILLGSKAQMQALDSYKKTTLTQQDDDQEVFGPVWRVRVTKHGTAAGGYTYDIKEKYLIYPGDADVETDTIVYSYDGTTSKPAKNWNFTLGNAIKENGRLQELSSINTVEGTTGTTYIAYVGVDDEGNPDMSKVYDNSADYPKTNLKYAPGNNYIVFRDIDLNNENWTPLMFFGEMYGTEQEGAGTLRENGFVNRPTISNVNVQQTGQLDVTMYTGVGFFATLKEEVKVGSTSNIVAKPVIVKNIELEHVTVNNQTTEAKTDTTLVDALTDIVGVALGVVLDGLLKVLSIGSSSTDFKNSLKDLLNARKKDPSSYATGAFAGRMEGTVQVDNCRVNDVSITTTSQSNTGGFVGYSVGVTQYDGLSKALDTVVSSLSTILNVIPWLGLGDLVTILLGNTVAAGKLIPIGYTSPVITNSNVNDLKTTLGNATGNGAGGFVGTQIGTHIEHSSVTNSPVSVKANSYGGGFAGLSRDGEIDGALSGLGIDLVDALHPQSVLLDCTIDTGFVTVDGEKLLGGFVGAQSESYAVNCTMSNLSAIEVTASDSYAGGFSGYSTLGYLTTLGTDEVHNTSLVSVVKELLTGLLSSESSANEQLLSLVGVSPSAIMGCQMAAGNISVEAKKDYAGGIVGKGDGLYITSSTEQYLQRLPLWSTEVPEGSNSSRKPVYKIDETDHRKTTISGLQYVHAGRYYAGGIAGEMDTANAVGLLTNTLGVGGFIGFTVDDVDIVGAGDGLEVRAGDSFAAGGIGEATGGTIKDCSISEILKVTAGNNYAGGFLGRCGPGTVAESEGLQLNLLGLNNVAKVTNLLSVGAAINTDITNCSANGIADGFFVEAQGDDDKVEGSNIVAAGFVAQANSVAILNSHVTNLNYVKANNTNGITGGFVGKSTTGDLADVGNVEGIGELLKVNGLLNAVSYMIPDYKFCDVTYVSNSGDEHTKGYVESAIAGGFAGDFQSGFVNYWNDKLLDDEETKAENAANRKKASESPWAVYNIDHVSGQYYGGGFGGKVYSGALASAGKGISILGGSGLNINLGDLLSLVEAYVPIIYYAGVNSEKGFTVTAAELKAGDKNSGSAGGYIGYASGAQVSYSDVKFLRHEVVSEPKDLEVYEASSYFDPEQSSYSVTGGRYAGGYMGLANIGSAASLGQGLGVLGEKLLSVNNILSALNTTVTTVEHSNVYGGLGGFDILATQKDDTGYLGDAGGFAGAIKGAHIQDANSYLFIYIIGRKTAGGYVGNLEPGSIAEAIGSLSLLNDLVKLPDTLLSVGQDFIPTIRNSETTCVPCGGAVRAEALSDNRVRRGMAGGYCGHNEGGQIWGWNDDAWKDENVKEQREGDHIEHNYYTGPQRECAAIRILSVYGTEFAGGFTGKMEAADTAQGGSLELLGGLLSADNLLGALKAAYPTEENTAVYGPLYHMDYDLWTKWITYVAQYGGMGQELLKLYESGKVTDQASLNREIAKYEYGYHTVAGRKSYTAGTIVADGGVAGGYVGQMKSGVITNGQAHHAKKVVAMKAAGGFVGEALVGGLAEVGSVTLFKNSPLKLNLNVGALLNSIVDVFVPVIKNSSVAGYQSGLTVEAKGVKTFSDDLKHNLSNAGGYIGNGAGVQIWGDDEKTAQNKAGGCNVTNLLEVRGNRTAGGYGGNLVSGSTLDLNTTEASDGGMLNELLTSVVDTPSSLASVLNATVSTVRNAHVKALNTEWGYTVEGVQTEENDTPYAMLAGGFVGNSEATIFGDKDLKDTAVSVSAEGLRGVNGGEYAGGFFGLADINGVASVAKDKTTVAGLINAGDVSVIDAFKTYVYSGNVTGVPEGFVVRANEESRNGILDATRYTGCAGGFGGGLMNGNVTYSTVENLNAVTGLNYTGGFLGHMGKSGIVTVDDADVGTANGNLLRNLLGASAGVLNIFGGHAENCSVSGIADGFTVSAHDGTEPIAAGFAAYADLSRILNSTVTNLKYVSSDGIAGGFVGLTSMAYLVTAEVNGELTKLVVNIVNALLKILQVNKLENLDLVDVGNQNKASLFGLRLLADGDLLYVNLLGLKIGVSLDKPNPETGKSEAATVTIGDSSIRLPVSDNGEIQDLDNQNIEINLIKGNRTKVDHSSVTGVKDGYDVYGGGATYDADGTKEPEAGVATRGGYAGGFVGNNKEGKIQDCEMVLCDVVRGTPNYVGPFSGVSSINSVYSFNDLASIEGQEDGKWNVYHVYRTLDTSVTGISGTGWSISGNTVDTSPTEAMNRYDVNHLEKVKTYSDWEDAKNSKGEELKVYETTAKAVLMLDTPLSANLDSTTGKLTDVMDPCITLVDITITKKWSGDSLLGVVSEDRPDSIMVHLTQKVVNAEGEPVNMAGYPKELLTEADVLRVRTRTGESEALDYETGIQLTKDDQMSVFSVNTWRIAIEDLPATLVDGGNIYYFQYTLTEDAVPNYNTEITPEYAGYQLAESNAAGETLYEFTIENTYDKKFSPPLPSTGGRGIAIFILAGMLIVALGMMVKTKRDETDPGTGGEPGA